MSSLFFHAYLEDLVPKTKTTVPLSEAALVNVVDEDLRSSLAVLGLVAEREAQPLAPPAAGQLNLLPRILTLYSRYVYV